MSNQNSMFAKLLVTKPLDVLMAESQETGEHSLKRALGPLNLITLGIGAIIGAGIFVLTGSAAANYAGPAIVFSFMGFVFAAPGAVYINGRLTRLQNGLVSVMGPGLNLSLGAAMMFVGIALPLTDLTLAIYLIGRINIFLALFNLLPIPPLDGYNVAKWNVGVYIVVMGASVVLFLFSMGII